MKRTKAPRTPKSYCTYCHVEVRVEMNTRASAHSLDGKVCPGTGVPVQVR